MPLALTFASGESSLEVDRFAVEETISGLFSVQVWAGSTDPSLDLGAIAGRAASLRAESGWGFALLGAREWSGICCHIAQERAEPSGRSLYHLILVPTLWPLRHRRNYRIFQHQSGPDIAGQILDEWGIPFLWQIDRARHPRLPYKVQYGESDYAFVSRLLEEAGVAFVFAVADGQGSKLALADGLETRPRRPPLPWTDNPTHLLEVELCTKVGVMDEVRSGASLLRDHDFRKPDAAALGEAPKATGLEAKYEQYRHRPGSSLADTGAAEGTPFADDLAFTRHDPRVGTAQATLRLGAERADKCVVSFQTNALDLCPGAVFTITGHPHAAVARPLLVSAFAIEGTAAGDWTMRGRAVRADHPYLPPRKTPKPRATGVQSARVVGFGGEEIHTDEFGRVRVQFPWDRLGKNDEHSSCWIRVSQAWAGRAYGTMFIPRVGQEVLVGFLDSDPEQPVVVGRVHDRIEPPPHKLPDHKTRSTWKSDTSPGSGGFNEIMLEDAAGSELFHVQAQKNQRELVKHDETITVGEDRAKVVQRHETDTTLGDRTEVTAGERRERTDGRRVVSLGAAEGLLVKGTLTEPIEGEHQVLVGGDEHLIVKKIKREWVFEDLHLGVGGGRSESVGGQSLAVSGQHEKVSKNHALETGLTLHLKAGTVMVAEGATDVTAAGPGGFIRIDASGITIQGTLVLINAGGSPGSAPDAAPAAPELPKPASVPDVRPACTVTLSPSPLIVCVCPGVHRHETVTPVGTPGGGTFRWDTSNDAIADVTGTDASADVAGVSPGTAIIGVTYAVNGATASAQVPVTVASVELVLMNTGKVVPAPENTTHDADVAASGGVDDLGPLPMGQGRRDFPNIAYTSPLLVIGTVTPAAALTLTYRWKRLITRRSWNIRKNAAGTRWTVIQRTRRGFPDDDTGSGVFNSAIPSASHKIYIYDDSALLPESDPANQIGDFIREEKDFTYRVEVNVRGTFRTCAEIRVGQIIITRRKAATGTVATDWDGVENSTAIRTLDATLDAAEVRGMVGGALPIDIDAHAND